MLKLGPWIAAGLIGLFCGYLWLRNDALSLERDAAVEKATAAEKTIEDMRANAQLNRQIVEQVASLTDKVDKGAFRVEKEVRYVEKTSSCSATPAVRVGLGGLRRELRALEDSGESPRR